ncbi:MAG TPA: methyltransferase domain-containing protein [Polyangiaceae bacterium]|jgi:ubiquinone/menaquinone biosynthesis C-methylase UbiE|nr:methyltransferase domain-containing protein [Polyangiaceae bacterium]
MAAGHGPGDQATRSYYDEFSRLYDAERRPNRPSGYHALIDDLEVEVVRRHGSGRDVLECGAGTGLLLERFAQFARSAKGIDLSPGMLDRARERGLAVREASVTSIPFNDQSFDVTCAFKVLAHVPEIGRALAEMARVTRPGGVVVAEFYNPVSLRGLVKRLGPAAKISSATRESAVYTRFDAPWVVPRLLPPSLTLESVRGVRIVTPAAAAMRVPGVRAILRTLERRLADTRAAFFAGFYVAVLRKSAAE